MIKRAVLAAAVLGVAAFVSSGGFLPVALAASPGAVYTMTNAVGSNSVVVYNRAADGSLSQPQAVPTGGSGTGSGLGSQGSIALSEGGRWLLAVNAGSNDVTVFSVDDGQLTPRSRQSSGGAMPASVTIHGDRVFVLNTGGSPNLAGFRVNHTGVLVPIPGAQRLLAGAGPAQVAFDDQRQVSRGHGQNVQHHRDPRPG